MYPLKKGKTASQAHVGLPNGTYEEEHGRKGFYVVCEKACGFVGPVR